MESEYGEKLRRRSKKKVIKRTILNLFVKINRVNMEVATRKLRLSQDLGFTVFGFRRP